MVGGSCRFHKDTFPPPYGPAPAWGGVWMNRASGPSLGLPVLSGMQGKLRQEAEERVCGWSSCLRSL